MDATAPLPMVIAAGGSPRVVTSGEGHRRGTTLPLPHTIPAMRDPRLEKLADVIVNYSTGVKPGQIVRISSPTVAAPLAVELYRKALAAGGHPLVRMSPDELS